MTPLERAARAMMDNLPAQDDIDMDGASAFKECARAVLTAIREPSEGMQMALLDGLDGEVFWRFSDGNVGSVHENAWQAMIDAALAEDG